MERFDYDGLLEVNSDLRNQLANAQATVEALQALVRALPMVRIELNGAYHDTLLAWPEDYAVKELLRYRASLDATTPATTKT